MLQQRAEDGAGGGDYGPRSLRVLRPGGVLVSLVPSNLAEAGAPRAEIDSVFPLEDAAKAHERGAAGGVTGKIVLTV